MTHTETPPDHNEKRMLQLAVLSGLLTLWVIWRFASEGIDFPEMAGCAERTVDFHAFWGAGQLALQGAALDAFDYERLREGFDGCVAGELRWLHPAHLMPFVTLLGTLPYVVAWTLLNIASLIALGFALRPYCKGQPAAFIAVLLAPAMLSPLLIGQLTLLWIAGLLAALTAIRSGKPILAGILIGILTFKPTLGLLIPIMLIAINQWKTIITAIATTLTLIGGATAYYGLIYWTEWRNATGGQGSDFIEQMSRNDAMTSFSTLLARLGLPPQMALIGNIILGLILAVIIFVAWRRLGAKSDAAIALLLASIPLTTPYLWHYDAAFLPVVALFLIRHKGWQAGEIYWGALALLWLGPGLSVWNTLTIDTGFLVQAWTVPLQLLLGLGMALHAVTYTKHLEQT